GASFAAILAPFPAVLNIGPETAGRMAAAPVTIRSPCSIYSNCQFLACDQSPSYRFFLGYFQCFSLYFVAFC
ncbi:hypothetical protein, partial [[Clostridium] polysaccharolyticum]|uniref:hypothetical protein n=1 Tax=[Clostridium] polysaccharolyticum TaxID=29364 RepID=UPI001A9A6854